MPTLRVASGEEFRVDQEDYEWCKQFRWHLCNGYPARSDNGASVYLHRELMNFPIGHVHHLDEDSMDCRRRNLRVMSPKEHHTRHAYLHRGPHGPQAPRNIPNRTIHPPKSQSGYKGVVWSKTMQRWVAKTTYDKKVQFLGHHETPEDAAVVYDAFVLAFRPRGSYTNLIPG